ncbi:MAG: hypothetical protein IJV75_05465 [Alphaproteobacteria bacterium]|nr:hypothetical protein [Alphaproteobacteria bacterium]
MHSLQKMSFSVLLCGVLVASLILFTPTDTFGALPKKKLEIIIGGENFCKDDKDCAGDSFCNMTSHICITCPKPFEWVGGTQCVCPSGTVPNADNTDCVECMTDPDCQDLKGNLHWVCDTDTNTCACMSGLHEVGGECECDNPKKTLNEDGNCNCQLSQADCPTSDFTDRNDCKCCPSETPKWDGLECRTCADVNRTKPYYNPSSHTCVECLTDEQCTDGVCIDNTCYPCREDSDCAGNKVCQDKQCVCEMTSTDCPTSDFTNAEQCACCPVDKPKWDGTTSTCKACSEIDATKPYYNSDTKTCEECLTDAHCENEQTCSADKKCVCELTQADCAETDFNNIDCLCCPADKPVWDKETKQCVEDTCYARMIAAGFSKNNFMVSDQLVTYEGTMDVKTDLDLSQCDLKVNGQLIISKGTTLVRNVDVVNLGSGDGINLSSATTLKSSGRIISTISDSEHGIRVSSGATMTAQGNIEGIVKCSLESIQAKGIYSEGNVTAQGDIIGTVTAGTASQSDGVESGAGLMTAQGSITGTVTVKNGEASQSYGVHVKIGGITAVTGNIIGTVTAGTASQSYGVDVSDRGTMTAQGGITGTVVTAGLASQSYGVDVSDHGTMTAQGSITGTVTAGTASQSYGVDVKIGGITAVTGNIIGTVTVERGRGSQSYGVEVWDRGTMTAQGSITGTVTVKNGEASQSKGVHVRIGEITAVTGNIIGTVTAGTASQSYGVGVRDRGAMTAQGSITGTVTASQSDGIVVYSSGGTITAKNIYYCPEERATTYGVINGSITKRCP